MENTYQQSSSKDSEGVCQRIHRAVNGGRSPFKSLRRGSPRPHTSNVADVAVGYNHASQPDTYAATKTETAKTLHKPRIKDPKAQEVKRVTLVEDFHYKPSQEKHAHHHESHFSDYITRVRERISRTMTLAGGGDGGGGGHTGRAATMRRRDSFNEKVSNYIHRARLSMRTTSNIGDHGDGKNK